MVQHSNVHAHKSLITCIHSTCSTALSYNQNECTQYINTKEYNVSLDNIIVLQK